MVAEKGRLLVNRIRGAPDHRCFPLSFRLNHGYLATTVASVGLRGSDFFFGLRSRKLSPNLAASIPDFAQEIGIGVAMKDKLGRLRDATLNRVSRHEQGTRGILRARHAEGSISCAGDKVFPGRHLMIADKKWERDIDHKVSRLLLGHGNRNQDNCHNKLRDSKHERLHTMPPEAVLTAGCVKTPGMVDG